MSAGARPARRCLVIHPGALGDVILALPALAHLARLDPPAERTLVAAGRLGRLLAGSPFVERGLDFEALGLQRLFEAEAPPAALAPLTGYHVIVSWFGSGDTAYRANLARLGCPVVIARAAPPAGAARHVSRHLLDTLAPVLPSPHAPPAVRLPIDAVEREWATAWLAARGLARGDAIVLHPGSGAPAKVWPEFPALARTLVATGAPCLVLVGPADADAVARVVASTGLPDERVARDLGPRRLAALLEAARLFVGHDSGPTHLAAAVGCPLVALFGPTDPVVWAPGFPPGAPTARVLAGAGPSAADPWTGLTVSRVARAVAELLLERTARPRFAAPLRPLAGAPGAGGTAR